MFRDVSSSPTGQLPGGDFDLLSGVTLQQLRSYYDAHPEATLAEMLADLKRHGHE